MSKFIIPLYKVIYVFQDEVFYKKIFALKFYNSQNFGFYIILFEKKNNVYKQFCVVIISFFLMQNLPLHIQVFFVIIEFIFAYTSLLCNKCIHISILH
jgi:hypothetical protein